MDPACHTLTLPSPCAAQFAVMEAEAFPKLPRCALPSWRTIPFSRPVSSPSRPRRLTELTTCLTPIYDSPSSPSPPWVRHGWRLSSSRSPARFASSSSYLPNPLYQKFLHDPSFLLDLSFASPLDQSTGNPWFCGRRSPVSSRSTSTSNSLVRSSFSSLDGSNRP